MFCFENLFGFGCLPYKIVPPLDNIILKRKIYQLPHTITYENICRRYKQNKVSEEKYTRQSSGGNLANIEIPTEVLSLY